MVMAFESYRTVLRGRCTCSPLPWCLRARHWHHPPDHQSRRTATPVPVAEEEVKEKLA